MTENNDQKLYECPECGLHYTDEGWMEKCRKWCNENHSCNVEITEYSVEMSESE